MNPVARLRRANAIADVVLLVEAILLAVVLATNGRPAGFTVIAEIDGRLSFGRLVVSEALIVLVMLVAAFRLIAALPVGADRRVRALDAGLRTARWVEAGFVWPIILVVLAAVNGVAQVAPLVGIYALTSAVALFGILQDRMTVRIGHPKLPLAFGSAVGIVPWGIIGFRQVGGLLTGNPTQPIVVVITLVALGLHTVWFVGTWREQDAGAGERWHVVWSTVTVSILAWLMVLGVG